MNRCTFIQNTFYIYKSLFHSRATDFWGEVSIWCNHEDQLNQIKTPAVRTNQISSFLCKLMTVMFQRWLNIRLICILRFKVCLCGCSAHFRDHSWFLAVYYIDCSETSDHPDVCVCMYLWFNGVVLHHRHVFLYPAGWSDISVVLPGASNSFMCSATLSCSSEIQLLAGTGRAKGSFRLAHLRQLLLKVPQPQLHLLEAS